MQAVIRYLRAMARKQATVFALGDLRALLPNHKEGAFRSLIARLETSGELRRVCRGIYVLPDSPLPGSELLGCTAARLRPHRFNYLSLETVLSDAGIISQILLGRITLMSSGRSNVIPCGAYGTIEFVHTQRTAAQLASQLTYDSRNHLWRATPDLALRDMRITRRDTGLVVQGASA